MKKLFKALMLILILTLVFASCDGKLGVKKTDDLKIKLLINGKENYNLEQDPSDKTVFNLTCSSENDVDLTKIKYSLNKTIKGIKLENNNIIVDNSFNEEKVLFNLICKLDNQRFEKAINITKPKLESLTITGDDEIECNNIAKTYTVVKTPVNSYLDTSKLEFSLSSNLIEESRNKNTINVKANVLTNTKQKITVTYNNKNYEKEITLNSAVVESLSVNEDKKLLFKGNELEFKAVVNPNSTGIEKVTWSIKKEDQQYVELIDNENNTCTLRYKKEGGNIGLTAKCGEKHYDVKNIKTYETLPITVLFNNTEKTNLEQKRDSDTNFIISYNTSESLININKITSILENSITGIQLESNKLTIKPSFNQESASLKIKFNYENQILVKTINITKPKLESLTITGDDEIECDNIVRNYTVNKVPSNSYLDTSKLEFSLSSNLIKDSVDQNIIKVRAINYSKEKQEIKVDYNNLSCSKEINLRDLKTKTVTIENDNKLILKGQTIVYSAKVSNAIKDEIVTWSLNPGDDRFVTLVDNKDNTCSLTYKEVGYDIVLKATSGEKSTSLENIKTIEKLELDLLINKNEVDSVMQVDDGSSTYELSCKSKESLIDQKRISYSIIEEDSSINNNKLIVHPFETLNKKVKINYLYNDTFIGNKTITINKPKLKDIISYSEVLVSHKTESVYLRPQPSNAYIDFSKLSCPDENMSLFLYKILYVDRHEKKIVLKTNYTGRGDIKVSYDGKIYKIPIEVKDEGEIEM